MNLDELQSIRDRERQTDNLQQLRDSFYTEAGEYIQELRAERDRIGDQVDDPWNSPEANRLNDEIETATTLVQDIRDRRIGKLVKKASLDAAGLPAEVTGLSAEEQELFERLVDEMEVHRQHVMEIIEGGGASSRTDEEPEDKETTDGEASTERREVPPPDESPAEDNDDAKSTADSPNDNSEGSTAPSSPDEQAGDTHRTPPPQEPPDTDGHDTGPAGDKGPDSSPDNTASTDESDPPQGSVRPETDSPGNQTASDGASPADRSDRPTVERQRVLVTENVDTFVGSDDRDYDLSPNDVVMLPTPNATVLVERDAARRL